MTQETASDLAAVKFIFRGETNTPAAVSNEVRTVSYLIHVDGGAQYTLSSTNFDWPAYEHINPLVTNYDECGFYGVDCSFDESQSNEKWHYLSFDGFHNDKVEWIINRNREPQAIAESSRFETVDDLARIIRLDASEFTNWLEAADGKLLPATFSERMTEPRKFKIPNTIYTLDNLPYTLFWEIPHLWRAYEDLYRKADGYKVVFSHNASLADTKTVFKEKYLHGVIVLAHREEDVKGVFYSGDGYMVGPEDLTVHHKLGGLKLVVCWGAYRDWHPLISSNAYFWATSIYLHDWAFLSGYVPHKW